MTDSVKALKAQLLQLETLHQSGALSDVAWSESKTSLERRLLDLVLKEGGDVSQAQTPARPGWKLWLACGSFVVVLAAAGYAWKGSPFMQGVPAVAGGQDAAGGSPAPDAAQVEAMVSTLAERLKNKPDDGPGWAMLARSYAALGQAPQALDAFKKAVALNDKDAGLLADYADVIAYSRQGAVQGEPVQLVAQALKLEPANTKALALAGSFAFATGDFARAIGYWEKLKGLAPPGTAVDEIDRAIAQARERQSTAAPAASAPGKESQAKPGATVSGSVTLAPQAASQVRPEDTVFVSARPADGSRMPLAVLRRQAKDLPLTFSLDDSMAMSADRVLSSAGQVVITARISRSGNAMTQPGDIVVQTEPLRVGTQGIKLELGRPAPP